MLDKQRIRAFVLGGLAGAVAGILFAPKSGKELRGSITSRAGEAARPTSRPKRGCRKASPKPANVLLVEERSTAKES